MSMLLLGLRTGLSKYWRPLLAILLICVYTYKVYQYGEADADATWTAVYNERVNRQNTRIAELETLSTTLSKDIEAKDAGLAARLAALAASGPKIQAKTRQGEDLRCGQEVIRDVYLGPDFSSKWNSINSEANK